MTVWSFHFSAIFVLNRSSSRSVFQLQWRNFLLSKLDLWLNRLMDAFVTCCNIQLGSGPQYAFCNFFFLVVGGGVGWRFLGEGGLAWGPLLVFFFLHYCIFIPFYGIILCPEDFNYPRILWWNLILSNQVENCGLLTFSILW